MKKSIVMPWSSGMSLAWALSGCPQQEPPKQEPLQAPVARHSYVSFPALGTATPLQVAGRLSLPTSAEGKYLSAHPSIDASRIGIMGFSWGGVMSMLSATRRDAVNARRVDNAR